MITYIHTPYLRIRIRNCKLTFVWQSGWSRKSTLSSLHNCYLYSTRSVGWPSQGPPETPTTLELHDGIADMLMCMEQGNTTDVIFEEELYFISIILIVLSSSDRVQLLDKYHNFHWSVYVLSVISDKTSHQIRCSQGLESLSIVNRIPRCVAKWHILVHGIGVYHSPAITNLTCQCQTTIML